MADRRNRQLLAPVGLGFELAAIVVTLTVIGLWVDRHYGTAPWGSLVGAGLGLAGGLYNFLLGAKRALRDSAASRTGQRQADDPPARARSESSAPRAKPDETRQPRGPRN